jgi:hypothetical protein
MECLRFSYQIKIHDSFPKSGKEFCRCLQTHGRHPVTPISIYVSKENITSIDTVFTDLKNTISKIKLLLQAAQDLRQKA